MWTSFGTKVSTTSSWRGCLFKGQRSVLWRKPPFSPAFNNPDNIIFRHIRHVEVVRPCGLGEREEAIKLCAEIAYMSQRLLVDNDSLKEFLDDLQLPICPKSEPYYALSLAKSVCSPTMEV